MTNETAAEADARVEAFLDTHGIDPVVFLARDWHPAMTREQYDELAAYVQGYLARREQ